MTRYYHPETKTECLEGIHDLEGCTKDEDMPEASREWFERPAREGMEWVTDATGKFPIEQEIPPATSEQLARQERAWAQTELARTDFIMLPDSGYDDTEKGQVRTYRAALRNPTRSQTAGFPDASWRPAWPENVKRPGEG